MNISEKLKGKLDSRTARLHLAAECGVGYSTLTRWLLYDNEKFATLKNIAAIEKITGLKQEEIFEQEVHEDINK